MTKIDKTSKMCKQASKSIEGGVERTVGLLAYVESNLAFRWTEEFIREYVVDKLVIVSSDSSCLMDFEEHWGRYFDVVTISVPSGKLNSLGALRSILVAEKIQIEDVVWLSNLEPPNEFKNLLKAVKSY